MRHIGRIADNEQELLQRLSKGDSKAFALIFNRYYRDMVLFAGSWLSGNREQCEDVVQEAFIALWNDRREVLRIDVLRSYLLKSVQNRCISVLRHEQVKGRYADLQSLMGTDITRETEEYILYSELNDRLREALSHLSPVQRQCFEMNRLQGMRQTEIAEALGIPLRTVELRIAESLKFLKKYLKEYFMVVGLLMRLNIFS